MEEWPVHSSSPRVVLHNGFALEVRLLDYGYGAGPMISIDIAAEVETSCLDLSLAEAAQLHRHVAALLALAEGDKLSRIHVRACAD